MLTCLLVTCLVILSVAYIYKRHLKDAAKYADIPAVGYRIPFIGNKFPLSQTHLILTQWAKVYGPIFRFSLFGEEIVVLNDYGSIHEALVVKGSDFAGRPRMRRTDYQNRNKNSIVWQSYTPKLKFLRKQIHSSLRMYGAGLDKLQNRCYAEIDKLLSHVESVDGKPFDPWPLLYNSASNIMLDLTLGLSLSHDGREMARLKEINELFNHSFGPGTSRILDQLPMFNFLQHEYKGLKKALDLRDKFWKDHRNNCDKPGTNVDCIISDLQKLSSDDKYSIYDLSENTFKETFTNLILAGTDTTATSLTCLLLVLTRYPEIQDKIQEELDRTIVTSRAPTLSDRGSVPYLEASLLETLRFISHVPLAVPHSTICDTMICGKRIPKDTTVYINLWALHHDDFWKNPWKFDPHRFLDTEGRLVPSHHICRKRLMAFGAGRRVCLGETLAKNRLFLFSASLLKKYRFVSYDGDPIEDIDPRDFSLGIVLHPRKFKIRAIKRRCHVIGADHAHRG